MPDNVNGQTYGNANGQFDDQIDWLRLIRSKTIGNVTFYKLLERFGTAGAALEGVVDLSGRGGKKIKPFPKEKALREFDALQEIGGEIITRLDPAYPPLLATIFDAPPVISLLGNKSLLAKKTIAIVGARNSSLNGQRFAKILRLKLARVVFWWHREWPAVLIPAPMKAH